MTAENQDVSFVTGDRIDLRYAVTNDATGDAVDLTSATAIAWRMSKIYTLADGTENFSGTASVSKTLLDDVTISGADNNVVVVALGNDDTKNLSPGKYHCELEITELDGDGPYTVASGVITLIKELIK